MVEKIVSFLVDVEDVMLFYMIRVCVYCVVKVFGVVIFMFVIFV